MPSLAAKPLYYADDVNSLTAKAELDPTSQNAPPMRLSKTVSLVLTQAKQYDVKNDEELAYLMFMKYLNIVTAIKKSGDYKKDRNYYDTIIGTKNIKESLDRAEKLKASLKMRYEERTAEELAARLDRENYREQEVTNDKNGATDELILPDVPQHELDDILDSSEDEESGEENSISIAATRLYELLTNRDLSCLVIDLREECDYNESNIKLENTNYVNIPPTYINPKTPLIRSILNNITDEQVVSLLNNRAVYDHIILIDWDSSVEEGIEKTNPIHILHDALFVWDNQCKLKSEPLVVEGGYKNWLRFYPQYTTNSSVRKNQTEVHSFKTLDQIGDFYDMSYFEKPKPQEPVQPVRPAVQPVNTTGPPAQQHVNSTAQNLHPVRPNGIPNVNRSVKPSHLYNGPHPQSQPHPPASAQPTGPPTNKQNGVTVVTGMTSPTDPPIHKSAIPPSTKQQPSINQKPESAHPAKPDIPNINRALKPGLTTHVENKPQIENSAPPVHQQVAPGPGNRDNADLANLDDAIQVKFAEYKREKEENERKQIELTKQHQLELDELKRLKENAARDLAIMMRLKKQLQDNSEPTNNVSEPHDNTVQSKNTETTNSQPIKIDAPATKPDSSTHALNPKPEIKDQYKPPAASTTVNSSTPTLLPINNQPSGTTVPSVQTVSQTPPSDHATDPVFPATRSEQADSSVKPEIVDNSSTEKNKRVPPVPVNQLPAGYQRKLGENGQYFYIDRKTGQKSTTPPTIKPSTPNPTARKPAATNNSTNSTNKLSTTQHPSTLNPTIPPQPPSHATQPPSNATQAPSQKVHQTPPAGTPGKSQSPFTSRPHTSNIPKPASRTIPIVSSQQPTPNRLGVSPHAQPNVTQHSQPNVTQHLQPDVTKHLQPDVTQHLQPDVTKHLQPDVTKHSQPHAPRITTRDAPPIKTNTEFPGRFTGKLKDETSYDLDGGIKSRTSASQSKGGMKRFNSQPDLSKLVEDEPEPIKQNIPQINRSVKPPTIADRSTKPVSRPRHDPKEFIVDIDRHRLESLCPSYGSTKRGLTGLYNLGNQCYMNAALQCLSHTTELREFLRGNNYADCVNISSSKGSKGVISRELAFLVKILWEGSYQYVQPRDFKRYFGYVHSKFDHMQQMDCQEFVIDILSTLHEDLNEKGEVKKEVPDTDNMSEERAVQIFKNYTQSTNQSKIFSLFYGLHRNSTRCTNPTCGYVSKSYQNFNSLELAIPVHGRTSLTACINKYLESEKVEYTCSKCKRKTDAVRKIDFWSLPNVLVCLLKRFDQSYSSLSKKANHVSFAHHLTISPCADSRENTVQYDLYGVINHTGSLESGHYTSYCNNGGKWYMFNDESVYPVHTHQVESPAAYILFYQRR